MKRTIPFLLGLCVVVALLAIVFLPINAKLHSMDRYLRATHSRMNIERGPVQPINPAKQHRVICQEWSVYHYNNNPNSEDEMVIEELRISVPGRVFIRQHDSVDMSPSATIRFSGNTDELFQYLEVIPFEHGVGAIQVRIRPHSNGYIASPYLLTEIILNRNQRIKHLTVSGTADVIVEEGMTVSASAMQVELHGSGDLYFTNTCPLVLNSLTTALMGSGNVFYSFQSSTVIETLTSIIGGSGSITLDVTGDLSTTSLNADLAGSSSICLTATAVASRSINTAIAGSGTIAINSLSSPGQCTEAGVNIFGSGAVYLGSIQCEDVLVGLMGSDHVEVQASRSIVGTQSGSGQIYYIGASPSKISDRSDEHAISMADKSKYKPIAIPVTNKETTGVHTCPTWSIPSREAVEIPSKFGENRSFPLIGLVVLALIAWCYLRRQIRSRRPRYGYPPGWQPNHATELQPLHVPQYPSQLHPQQP